MLLESYLADEHGFLDRLEGMWAFALYDGRQGKLLLSRDRFGEKPLYVFNGRDGFFFGSEPKLIWSLSGEKPAINQRQILRYLVNGYKSLYKRGETFFEGLSEIPAGCVVRLDSGGTPDTQRYWEPRFAPQKMTVAEAVDGVRERLIRGLDIRLRSDVPLAFCLSGGVDSAALVSLAAKRLERDVKTFSIYDTDPRYDERDNIQATVQDVGCANLLVDIPRVDFLERLKMLVSYHDAPVATISYYIHSFLSEAISRQGFRVAVSGTGADELFTGYYDHFNLFLYEIRDRPELAFAVAAWANGPGRFVRNPHLKDPQLYLKDPFFREHIYLNADRFKKTLKVPFAEGFEEAHYCDTQLRNRMWNELFVEAVPVILHADDLNSMYFSVENRSPYLDRRLFEFMATVPNELLIIDGFGKYLLREAVKGVVNDKVRLDQRKKGFNASVASLTDLDGETREFLAQDSPLYEWVDKNQVLALLKEKPLPNSVSKHLFYLLSAKMFLDVN